MSPGFNISGCNNWCNNITLHIFKSNIAIITSARVILFSLLSVFRLVCDQDYTKTTEQISVKLEWRVGLGPEWTPLTFFADPDKDKDP